jgi:transcriptional regulator with XRE-family HTH domain
LGEGDNMFWAMAKIRMDELDISMYRLSIEIGKDKGQVKTWITRGTIPPVDSALKIAQVLGVEIEYFFPELFPNKVNPSKLRRNFHEWVDSMDEEELKNIVDLFEVFDSVGKQLGK